MNKENEQTLEKEIKELGLNLKYFDITSLNYQLEQLYLKNKLVGELDIIKEYEPEFLINKKGK